MVKIERFKKCSGLFKINVNIFVETGYGEPLLPKLLSLHTGMDLFSNESSVLHKHFSLEVIGHHIEDTLNADGIQFGGEIIKIPLRRFPNEFYVIMTGGEGILYKIKYPANKPIVEKVDEFEDRRGLSTLGNTHDLDSLIGHLFKLVQDETAKPFVPINVLFYDRCARESFESRISQGIHDMEITPVEFTDLVHSSFGVFNFGKYALKPLPQSYK